MSSVGTLRHMRFQWVTTLNTNVVIIFIIIGILGLDLNLNLVSLVSDQGYWYTTCIQSLLLYFNYSLII